MPRKHKRSKNSVPATIFKDDDSQSSTSSTTSNDIKQDPVDKNLVGSLDKPTAVTSTQNPDKTLLSSSVTLNPSSFSSEQLHALLFVQHMYLTIVAIWAQTTHSTLSEEPMVTKTTDTDNSSVTVTTSSYTSATASSNKLHKPIPIRPTLPNYLIVQNDPADCQSESGAINSDNEETSALQSSQPLNSGFLAFIREWREETFNGYRKNGKPTLSAPPINVVPPSIPPSDAPSQPSTPRLQQLTPSSSCQSTPQSLAKTEIIPSYSAKITTQQPAIASSCPTTPEYDGCKKPNKITSKLPSSSKEALLPRRKLTFTFK